tara:strand:- start:1135 stop:1326 length:192 start_codon:yes stop_codon:yes gene_type:complete
MESLTKIKELKEKMSELQNLLEDFTNLYESKKNKASKLEDDIDNIKHRMNKYLDSLEELIEQK